MLKMINQSRSLARLKVLSFYFIFFITFFCTAESFADDRFKILPYGDDYRFYMKSDDDDDGPPWKPLTLNLLLQEDVWPVFCEELMISPSPSMLTALRGLSPPPNPDPIFTTSMLDSAVPEFRQREGRPFDQIFESLIDPNCIQFASISMDYERLQQVIENAMLDNEHFDQYRTPESSVVVPFPPFSQESQVTEGVCYDYTMARVFGYTEADIRSFLARLDTILHLFFLHEISDPVRPADLLDGDWVFYPGDHGEYNGGHWGVVRRVGEGFMVDSKWGSGPVRRHRVEEVPRMYGGIACYYRMKPDQRPALKPGSR